MPDHAETTNPRRTLTVTGRGTASADPDLTVLSFSVLGRDPSYSASVEELNGRVEALREDLEAAGVERARLKTTSFGVRDDRRYDQKTGKHVFVGYEASHRLRLELPLDKELLNGVLARVAASASEAAVTISFEVSDVESLRRRAMRAAVADAREGARVLAEASGATLGDILSIDYSYVEIRARRLSYEFADAGAMYSASAPAPDVEPEALDAEEGVTVVWEIS